MVNLRTFFAFATEQEALLRALFEERHGVTGAALRRLVISLRSEAGPSPDTGGRLDQRILEWLGVQNVIIWHCGDYDATGLNEYLRLSAACRGRARLFAPEELAHRSR